MIVLLEALAMAVLAILSGLAIGHLTALGISGWMRSQTAMYSPVRWVSAEGILALTALLLSLAVACVPALQVYRQDVAGNL